jgi:4-cresol dehydrogenase (hydroxylating) flavoprotein subunit
MAFFSAPKTVKPDSLASALSEWRTAIGSEHVLSAADDIAPYALNTNALSREIAAVVKPASTDEVQRVVRIANAHRTPLYPISGGRNWGYGSRLPVRDGATIVDLSRMNRIRNESEISVETHYATIEPGVTQAQLHAALHRRGLPLLFNATAAGAETSILGNSLDRGFGYFAMRPEDICGMEVVLGNGEILRTGFGHYPNAQMTATYKYGLGPSLDGLFFQSNFGVVTSAAFNLVPRRECHVAVLAKLLREEDFPKFIDALADLRRQGIYESVVHIGSRNRIRITLGPVVYNHLVAHGAAPGPELRKAAEAMLAQEKFGPWSAVGGLFGTRAQVREALREFKRRLRGIASVGTITPEKIRRTELLFRFLGSAGKRKRAVFEGAKPIMDFSLGNPSNGALLSPMWAIGETPVRPVDDLDKTRVGLVFCPPALPLEGNAARELVASVHDVFGRFGFEPFMTLNVVNTKALLCVLNLVFDRNDASRSTEAHRCVETLYAEWARRGIYPYRLGIQSMEQFIDAGDVFWQTARAIKHALDPNGIIAPGRYNLD